MHDISAVDDLVLLLSDRSLLHTTCEVLRAHECIHMIRKIEAEILRETFPFKT